MTPKRLLITILFFTIAKSSSPHFIGEVLHYTAGFRYFPAGNAILSIEIDSLNGETVYLLRSSVNTNSFLSTFYKVQDEIKSWLAIDNLKLIKTVQNIREGSYHQNHEAIIKGDSVAISGDKIKELPGKVYDPVAFVYFLRMQEILLGNRYSFLSYGRKKIKEVIVDVTAKETIEVPAGLFHCQKIEPVSGNGKPLLKNNGIMKVWLSDDSLHIPVKIEQNTNIGTMVMKLKKITHLIN